MRRAAAAAAAVVLLARVASAGPHGPEATDVDRDDSPPARGELGFDGGAPLGDWGVQASLGMLDRPITLRAADGVTTAPVSTRETLGLGGGIAVGDSAVVDLHVGFAHQAGDRFVGLGDDHPLATWVPLDARVGARIRVMDGAHVSVFLRGELTAPIGDERDFAGDAGWSGTWDVIVRAALPGGVIVAASGGVRLRGKQTSIADVRIGDETTGAVGAVVPVPPLCHLWCADQVALTGEVVAIAGDSQPSAHGPSPAEARVGVVSRPRPWLEVAARVGFGLDDEIGSPAWRAMLAVTWRQPSALVVAKRPVVREQVDDPPAEDE